MFRSIGALSDFIVFFQYFLVGQPTNNRVLMLFFFFFFGFFLHDFNVVQFLSFFRLIFV